MPQSLRLSPGFIELPGFPAENSIAEECIEQIARFSAGSTVPDSVSGELRLLLDPVYGILGSAARLRSGLYKAGVRNIPAELHGIMFAAGNILEAASSRVDDPARIEADDIHFFRGRLLLIDDNPGFQDSFSRLFGAAGYEVLCAEDGKAGLAVLEKNSPPVDAVILDLLLQNEEGLTVLESLTKCGMSGQQPVLVLTGTEGSCSDFTFHSGRCR